MRRRLKSNSNHNSPRATIIIAPTIQTICHTREPAAGFVVPLGFGVGVVELPPVSVGVVVVEGVVLVVGAGVVPEPVNPVDAELLLFESEDVVGQMS